MPSRRTKLVVAIAFFVALAGLAIGGAEGYVKIYAVEGHSMEPALEPGNLVIATGDYSIQKGDVIVYQREDGRAVHKVIRVRENVVVKGTSSSWRERVPRDDILAEVEWSIPYMGKPALWLKG